jgi:hypothetical protein
MDAYEFNVKYATTFIDNYGTQISFNPLHKKDTGSMVTTYKDGRTIGGEYNIREDNSNFYLGWYGKEYLFAPTEMGFDLLTGKTISYSFTKVEQ